MTSSFPLSMSSDMVRPGAGRGVQLVSGECGTPAVKGFEELWWQLVWR